MNLVRNRTQNHLPNLREEEVTLVENAIRLAIDSIVNVLFGVNGARSHEHRRTVADRDKEIRRLEGRLREIEHELQVLRRQGCTCSLFGTGTGTGLVSGSQAGGEQQQQQQLGGFDDVLAAAQQQHECEMSISLGLFAHDSAPPPPPPPPSRLSQEQVRASAPAPPPPPPPSSSSSPSSSEAVCRLATPPGALVVKEEPCDVDTVLVKWELSEDGFGGNQESRGSSGLDPDHFAMTLNHEGMNVLDQPQSSADINHINHIMDGGDHRNKKRSVPMSELPEEAQRQKRAAWRAASRRYYARKMARLQAAPAHRAPFGHMPAVPYPQPLPLVERRRRRAPLISHLPEESQLQQREAWRAASRRYYARKTARHQMDHLQYGHLLQGLEPGGGGGGGGGAAAMPDAHNNSDSIMCSS